VHTAEDPDHRNLSFHPGSRIAEKYVIERLIGEGGLGVVVAARHIHLDQTVAIKYLRPKSLASKTIAERFLREARLAAKIKSEHVVHVYDVGTLPDGAPYMVMEYLAGSDLGRQLSASGPLPVDRVVDYVLQACEGLAEAHVAGIIHRDIKPDNLFIATSPGGKSILKILDFGISKLSTKRSDSRPPELTEAGEKFGTPVYMSPEQLLASRDVDARTDVWAIGVVFFELLTGRLPFDGDSLPELCAAILTKEPVPLLEARPYLPEPLQRIIAQCLAKDIDQRFQNVAELAQELAPFAAPSWRDRVDHIVQQIQGTGDKVRPSLPAPAPMTRSQHEAPTMAVSEALPEERAVATTGSAAAWAPGTQPVGSVPPKRNRVRIAVSVGGAAAALLLGLLAVTGTRSADKPPTDRAQAARVAEVPGASAGAVLRAPTASAVPAPPTEAPVPSEDLGVSPEPAASAPESPAATATSSAKVRSGGRHAPRGAPSGSAAPAHADPNAVINPFE
jgi:serine/threonine-protein kinase